MPGAPPRGGAAAPHPAGTGRGAVRVGIGYVRGVGEAGGRRVDEERVQAGPFRSLFDFTQRTGLSREATTHLIRIGAFDGFGLHARALTWQPRLPRAGTSTVNRPAAHPARSKLSCRANGCLPRRLLRLRPGELLRRSNRTANDGGRSDPCTQPSLPHPWE